MPSENLFNPFPGLRPFEAEEDHLFFGREKEIDELLRRLRSTRFLSVVGSSGSGKSSLVRCGLISALYSGFMVKAGSSWRVAKFRPSEDPIGNLATALSGPDVLGTNEELADTNRILLEATLRRGTRGLVDAARQARIPSYENILVVVDQFEELFRFEKSHHVDNSRDEAIAFVKLLLEAAHQDELPIYIVLTMRADFIGDCMEFVGLPEAVNAGQYLIPRMSRDELRSAITGPVAVGGGQIAPRLVLRLLNDLGNDQDQLPVLQHALMRTWEYWEKHRKAGEALDIAHYEAVGTLREALSLHAEEAYQETGSDDSRRITERMFKALTDTFSDPRGVRRPTSVKDLAAICEVSESEIIAIVETFRRPGRSFLTPPTKVKLESRTIIDLSHESLMRCWTRLIKWAEEERVASRLYVRLSQAAAWHEEGTAGLWRDPELEIGLQWKGKNQPTAAWAAHHDAFFARAIGFLELSKKERDRVIAEREKERRHRLRRLQWTVAVLGVLLVVVGYLGYVARSENLRAELNLQLAQSAVDEMLSSAGRDQARVAEDLPQLEEFRKELLSKARGFYNIFTQQKPDNEKLRREMAFAHFRLGDIDRLSQRPAEAAKEYLEAATQFEALANEFADKPEYRQALANCYNWLGETLRTQQVANRGAAQNAYNQALQVQRSLVTASPQSPPYRRELARTLYNRGILNFSAGDVTGAEADFRESIDLLRVLSDADPNSPASQELARAYNNLANLLRSTDRVEAARNLYERAVQIHDSLVKSQPNNREYQQELATFNNNLAILALDEDRLDVAAARNQQAVEFMQELARPPVSLSIELANAHNLRCRILEQENPTEAERQCQQSFDILQSLIKTQSRNRPELQSLFRDLGYNYLELARTRITAGLKIEAQRNLRNLNRILPDIPEPHRSDLTKSYDELRRQVSS